MPRRLPIAIPYPHFMAFAPLDAWARLLFRPAAWIPPRYWLRLAFGLFTSAIGTALTLPERVVLGPVLWWRARQTGATLDHEPGAVVVLGYFRSGTTHLHYLLSCDPQFRTPRWCEAIAPQGFWLSWSFLRIFLIPFVSARRPQDDVAIGPEWPAEDDFALNNWAVASSLPGRFIVPQLHGHYSRFHSLEGLTTTERWRWRRVQWAFCWKLAKLAGSRAILLKTPSHTGRVQELRELFGGRVKFIHISRDPEAVIRSNVKMSERLHVYNLQDPPGEEEVRQRIVSEYEETERRYAAEAAALPREDVVEIAYEDLVRDPLGEARRAYRELGLAWTPQFETQAQAYLESVRDYRAAAQQERPDRAATTDTEQPRPVPALAREPSHAARAVIAAAATAIVLSVLWVAHTYFASMYYETKAKQNWFIWPVGIILGLVTIRTARVGTARLGLIAAALTVLVMAVVAVPAAFASDYIHRPHYRGLPMSDWEWYHILKEARVKTLAKNNAFWVFMGVVTAYRFASRRHVRPPGS